MFQNVEKFFLGTFAGIEQKFLKNLVESACEQGYTKFIDPCCESLATSYLAVQAGFKTSQVEASDISLFSGILGYAITGKSLKDFEIRAKGFSGEELLDPATAMYAWKYLSLVKNADKDYYYNYLIDLETQRECHIQNIDEQLKKIKSVLNGISYRVLDIWEHVEEVLDDEHAIVVINPPTGKAAIEKYYDMSGYMSWKAPVYRPFNSKTGLTELIEKTRDAKCLVISYETSKPSATVASPFFARYGVSIGVNGYLTSNRPDEAVRLTKGKTIARPAERDLLPLNCNVFPIDSTIDENSKLEICAIEQVSAQYYRKLWTHNFTGLPCLCNFAFFIDDRIAGVFGYDKSSIKTGAFGSFLSNTIFLMYCMTVPHKFYRLNRLGTMLAQNVEVIDSFCTDLEKVKIKAIKTVQMTRYPEAKEMRGIMKLTERKPDKYFGYRLTYLSDLKNRSLRQTLLEWLRKEKTWQKERQKNLK